MREQITIYTLVCLTNVLLKSPILVVLFTRLFERGKSANTYTACRQIITFYKSNRGINSVIDSNSTQGDFTNWNYCMQIILVGDKRF